ncbi:MAG TPA: TolC family protein [Burkholderiales bacterium]|nr:TolC family protein [Burkholderiales bacterium]
MRAGELQSPRLAAQRSAVTAASQQVGRAGELPDPKLRLGIENLPVTGADRFRYDRDFMTMRNVGVMQEFPNSAKREARNLRAERARDVETAGLEAQRAMLARDIAMAWLDVHYAERSRTALERLVRQFQLQVDTLAAGVARGRQSTADAFMARSALEQANDRIIEQERMIAKARIMLAALIGDDANRPLAAGPDTTRFAHSRDHLVARLSEHPELRMYEQREGLARAEADVARSTARSDWALEVGYGYRRPAFDNMLTVMVSIDLPWQKEQRQDRDIASKLAEVDQARALRENARRMHEAEVRGWLADFDTAEKRIERFERTLLPLARERSSAALAAYQGGRGELGSVLEAERAVSETELGLTQALAERGKAWANLNYLYPQGASR